MNKIFKNFVIFSLIVSSQAFADLDIPKPLSRLNSFPLDNTFVFDSYSNAYSYVTNGAITNSTAYKGQILTIPSMGTYYIDDNWELQEVGGSFTLFAGNNLSDLEHSTSKQVLFMLDHNLEHDTTWLTNIVDGFGVSYTTLMIPNNGQKGADGSNLKFAGSWLPVNEYDVDTIVEYGGQAYVSLRSVEHEESSPDENDAWMLLVSKGIQGEVGPQGIRGEEGPQGEQGVPGVNLIFEGIWNSNSVPYRSNSIVRYGTNLWYTLNDSGISPPNETTGWQIFLNDGSIGPQGIRGSTGPQGERGYPGYSFGNYAGSWNANQSYSSNEWVTYAGGTYGIVQDFTPLPNTVPSDYIADNIVVIMSLSGKDGVNGKNGATLVPYGEWSDSISYPQNALVRRGDAEYYCTVDSSIGEDPTTHPDQWFMFVKDGANISDAFITTNAFWAGKAENVDYCSNSIVYWDADGYGTYYVRIDCTNGQYGTMPSALNNTNYFTKIANYGKDGKNGINGKDGARGPAGLDGADGLGNVWYAGQWASEREYQTNMIVVSSNELYGYSMFISSAESININPGVTTNWAQYWDLAIKSGRDGKDGAAGANYKFSVGWSNNVQYVLNDICIVSNDFYLCNVNTSTGERPWIFTNSWTKLISPMFNTYALISSRQYAPGEIYHPEEVVRDDGSTYVVIADHDISNIKPSSDTNSYAILAAKGDTGPQGEQGPQGETGLTGATGAPGAGLCYMGNYDFSHGAYLSNSLVNTNGSYWYSIVDTTDEPSILSSDWKKFWTPTKIQAQTNGIVLNYDQNPIIQTNYDSENDVLTLVFSLPRGSNGVTKTPIPGNNNVTLPPISTNELAQATVTAGAITDTTIEFNFGIPAGLQGPQGIQGIQGERGLQGIQGPIGPQGVPGIGLVPRGLYETNIIYHSNDLVRFETAMYYVTTNAPVEGLINIPPLPETNCWELAIQDGAGGLSTNATLIVNSLGEEFPGTLVLDSETLMVESDGNNNYLKVIGGGGSWTPSSIVVTNFSYTIQQDDYLVWMDPSVVNNNQTIILPDMTNQSQTVIVRQLGNQYYTSIQRGTNEYVISGDGSSVAVDWLGYKTNWYWRQAY